MVVYYFDGSDAAVTDPNAVWTNEANAFDGSIVTEATTSTGGTTASNFMFAEGTNAPTRTSDILAVNARIYSDHDSAGNGTAGATIYTDGLAESLGEVTNVTNINSWGQWSLLTPPTGGWSWAIIQALEVKAYAKSITDTSVQIMRVEIDVSANSGPTNIGQNVEVGGYMSRNEVAS